MPAEGVDILLKGCYSGITPLKKGAKEEKMRDTIASWVAYSIVGAFITWSAVRKW